VCLDVFLFCLLLWSPLCRLLCHMRVLYLVSGLHILCSRYFSYYHVCVPCIECWMYGLFVLRIFFGHSIHFIWYMPLLLYIYVFGLYLSIFSIVFCVRKASRTCVSLNNFVIFLTSLVLYVNMAHFWAFIFWRVVLSLLLFLWLSENNNNRCTEDGLKHLLCLSVGIMKTSRNCPDNKHYITMQLYPNWLEGKGEKR
jgi:hypothetical protein